MPTCEISLLGDFRVSIDGHVIDRWPHRRAADLIKLLALAERHRMHREQVMEALWPDLIPEAAAANLRKSVHYARAALGSERGIDSSREVIALWPDAELRIDATEFERLSVSALDTDDEEACERSAALWHGELLPDDLYAPWADGPRDRLHLLALAVLKRSGRWERVLELDPADEEAHRAIMSRALEAGDRTGAIRQFERLRDHLRTDLGLSPDRNSVLLYEKALSIGGEPPSEKERARALISWGLVHLNGGALDEAEAAGREARSLAIDAGLGREVGEASALLGIVANVAGRWKELFREEFIDSVKRSPEITASVFDAHLCLAEFCLAGPTPYTEILSYARELGDIATEAGSLQGRALSQLLQGEAALFLGSLEEADSYLSSANALHEEAGAASGQVLTLQRLAEIAIARGESVTADRLLETGFELARTTRLTPHLFVRLHGTLIEAAVDPAVAESRVDHADAELARTNVCAPCSVGFRVAASIALARRSRFDLARRRLDEAERLAGMWPGGTWPAAIWEARASLRRAEGNGEQADALLREAATRYAEIGRARDAERCVGLTSRRS